MSKLASILLALALATTSGCAHRQISNRQVAIGVGIAVVAGVVIYAASQSHCQDNSCWF